MHFAIVGVVMTRDSMIFLLSLFLRFLLPSNPLLLLFSPPPTPFPLRGYMSELLFENYSIPAVAYGIDALFSAYHSYAKRGVPLQDALVVSSGHQATHIMPVLDGKFDARHCKR